MLPLFGSWLEATADLQKTAYDYDARNEPRFEPWIDYVRTQTLAAFVELGEFLQTLKWKPWGKNKGFPRSSRALAVEEMVDVLHFIANTLYALGVTDEELSDAYEKKMYINRQRMLSGGH